MICSYNRFDVRRQRSHFEPLHRQFRVLECRDAIRRRSVESRLIRFVAQRWRETLSMGRIGTRVGTYDYPLPHDEEHRQVECRETGAATLGTIVVAVDCRSLLPRRTQFHR